MSNERSAPNGRRRAEQGVAVVAAKPTAEFDATWGKGFMPPGSFLTLVYNTLS